MSKILQVNLKQLGTVISNSKTPIVVDFYAAWCPPCRVLEPILERLSDEFSGQVKFVKVDSDQETDLVEEFDVARLPTLILIDEQGHNEGRYLGPRRENDIRDHLQKWIASRKSLARRSDNFRV